jgi:hypothetical protein
MVTLIFLVIILSLLALVTERYIPQPKDNELKPGKVGYFLAWFSLFLCFLPIYQLVIGEDRGDVWFGLFTLTPGGLWAFMYLLTVKYKFDDNGLEVKSLVTLYDSGSWKHFQSIWYSPKSSSYVLEFSYGDIHIPNFLRNKACLIEFIESRGYKIE